MSQLSFYRSEDISEHVTRITSLTGEFVYLIKGEHKALLIDTCLGVGHLRSFVEGLTDKPIIVVLSHGHVDHAMGAPEFEQVYMNPADEEIVREHQALEIRKNYIQMALAGNLPSIEEADYVPPVEPHFNELKDGMVFDLGGIHIVIYETPGHTPGSITVLIKEERTLFLGDACNPFTFLFDEHALSVEEYKTVLMRLEERTRGTYDQVYLSHGSGTAPKEMLTSVIDVCQDIMEGNVDDIPFDFMGQEAFIAKAMGEDRKRIDGGLGNIVYNKEKIFVN